MISRTWNTTGLYKHSKDRPAKGASHGSRKLTGAQPTLIPHNRESSDRDWPEDFAHENGNYQCRCYSCGQLFYGHKRRITCKVCEAGDGSTNDKARQGK